jgi:hypothetical protein
MTHLKHVPAYLKDPSVGGRSFVGASGSGGVKLAPAQKRPRKEGERTRRRRAAAAPPPRRAAAGRRPARAAHRPPACAPAAPCNARARPRSPHPPHLAPPDPLKAIGFAHVGKKRSGGGGGRTEELTDLEKHALANPVKDPRAKAQRLRERVGGGPAAAGNVRKGAKAAKQAKRQR